MEGQRSHIAGGPIVRAIESATLEIRVVAAVGLKLSRTPLLVGVRVKRVDRAAESD